MFMLDILFSPQQEYDQDLYLTCIIAAHQFHLNSFGLLLCKFIPQRSDLTQL